MMNPRYPNLELIEYKAKQALAADPEFKAEFEKQSKFMKLPPDFDVIVFPQMWGSTCTGFDVCPDGSPAIGGCAMTKEYTTVVHELITDCYCVFFGDRACYKVTNANEDFINDLKNRSMASLSEAKKRY